jgi:hypothetical protein
VNAWKVILSTLVIFIAGVVTGGLLVTYALQVKQNRPKPPNSASFQGANPWAIRNRELLRRMDRELELTPEQHAHIETIIATSEERTRYLWKPILPQMNKEMQLVRGEIRDQLNPDQQKKFDGLAKMRQGQRRLATNSLLSGMTNSVLTNSLSTNVPATNP